jgi:flagellar hook-length control protein FliK
MTINISMNLNAEVDLSAKPFEGELDSSLPSEKNIAFSSILSKISSVSELNSSELQALMADPEKIDQLKSFFASNTNESLDNTAISDIFQSANKAGITQFSNFQEISKSTDNTQSDNNDSTTLDDQQVGNSEVTVEAAISQESPLLAHMFSHDSNFPSKLDVQKRQEIDFAWQGLNSDAVIDAPIAGYGMSLELSDDVNQLGFDDEIIEEQGDENLELSEEMMLTNQSSIAENILDVEPQAKSLLIGSEDTELLDSDEFYEDEIAEIDVISAKNQTESMVQSTTAENVLKGKLPIEESIDVNKRESEVENSIKGSVMERGSIESVSQMLNKVVGESYTESSEAEIENVKVEQKNDTQMKGSVAIEQTAELKSLKESTQSPSDTTNNELTASATLERLSSSDSDREGSVDIKTDVKNVKTESTAQVLHQIKADEALNLDALENEATELELEEAEIELKKQIEAELQTKKEKFTEQLNERIRLMTSNTVNKAYIQLDPPELGALELKIEQDGDKITVQIQTNNAQAKEILESQLDRLREMLEQQGLMLEHGDVSQQGQQSASNSQNEEGEESELETEQEVIVTNRLVDQYV